MNIKRMLTIIFFLMIGYAAAVATFVKDTHNAEAETITSETAADAADFAVINEKQFVSMSVPEGDTTFKSYMDFRTITNTHSAQYKLQDKCYTDGTGMRKYNGDYCIAVGSYYADKIGERLKITLDSGTVFFAVVSDFKADVHTDNTNRYTELSNGNKNVLEFIVDTEELPYQTKQMGDCSYNGFEGNVEKIERIDE